MVQPSLRGGIEGRIRQDSCLPESPGNGKGPPKAVPRRRGGMARVGCARVAAIALGKRLLKRSAVALASLGSPCGERTLKAGGRHCAVFASASPKGSGGGGSVTQIGRSKVSG